MRNRPQPINAHGREYHDYELYNYFVGNYGEEVAEWAMEYIREFGEMPEGY